MNKIEQLRNEFLRLFPRAEFHITAPLRAADQWTLDINQEGRHLVVDWTPPDHFGISAVSNESLYGEGPDEVFSSIDAVRTRLHAFLTTEQRPSPPLPALLARLRHERGFSQSQLARTLSVTQATISGIERRKDIQLSTLRRIITALGGSLRITALFSNASYLVVGEHSNTSVDPSISEVANPAPSRIALMSFPSLQRKGELNEVRAVSAKVSKRRNVFA
jgi:transcriptional regulator with XRE-family HTH domain